MTKKEAQEIFVEIIGLYNKYIPEFKSERVNPVLNFNKRTTALGLCKFTEYKRDSYTIKKWHPTWCNIYLSEYAMNDEASVRETLAHEIVHTFDNCQNHGKYFKAIASKFTNATGINITTRASSSECKVCGITQAKRNNAKYIVKCTCCGKEWMYQRRSKVVQRYRKYHCTSCGKEKGILKLIEL